MNKEKFLMWILILVIVLSIGSIMITNSDNVSEKINFEEDVEQAGSLNLEIIQTPENNGGVNENE